jgi:hypothetical protein
MIEQFYLPGLEPEKTTYFLLFEVSQTHESVSCVGEAKTLEEAKRWVGDCPLRSYEQHERERKYGNT